ncbi:hypothetical protein D3C81_2140390 [compost metagenome]
MTSNSTEKSAIFLPVLISVSATFKGNLPFSVITDALLINVCKSSDCIFFAHSLLRKLSSQKV